MSIRQERLILNQLHSSAVEMFNNIVTTGQWNANYSGVYVLKRPGVESNPYLKNPDIYTKDGKVYTMKNPELMTREISQYGQTTGRGAYHITSLKLINPANAPDNWERDALLRFEQGIPEMSQTTTLNGRMVYRLIRPLRYESRCVTCHSKQGYQIGQVRGGISVTLPFDQTAAILRLNQGAMSALAVAVVLILGFVFYFFVWRLMNQLAIQNVQLTELNRLRDEFLGIAAHDLRNPLNAINCFAELLLTDVAGVVNEQQRDCLQRIKRASLTMLTLINNLLDISKIESGKIGLRIKKTDLAMLFRENYQMNQMLAKNKQIELKLDLAPNVPAVEVDPERFSQVIDNVIGNALKFSHPNTTVTVRLRSLAPEQPNTVEIAIADQGQGIPADEVLKVFDKFYQTRIKSTAGEKSTGLGLAIVKKIVEAHHGTIRVESQVGVGTTFYVTLPIAKS